MTPSDAQKARMFDNILTAKPARQNRRPVFKLAASFAAAVVCLAVFGNVFNTPKINNAFSVKAYAMDVQEDGTAIMREVDLYDQTQPWSAHYDSGDIYLNVNLKCEGENIASVDFYTDDGFFAKQYIEFNENGNVVFGEAGGSGWIDENGVNHVMRVGTDYEKVGSVLTLSKNDFTDDVLLFWGTEFAAGVPLEDFFSQTQLDGLFSQLSKIDVKIRAVATFNDGSTQEEVFALGFDCTTGGMDTVSGLGLHLTPEEIEAELLKNCDITKITEAFINEAESENMDGIKFTGFQMTGVPGDGCRGIWQVNYDVLSEDKTEWVKNHHSNVMLSILGDRYTVKILTDDECEAIRAGDIPQRLLRTEDEEVVMEDGTVVKAFAQQPAE